VIKTELENLIPKIKSQIKLWRGKISTEVQSQIFEVINELVAAQDKIAEFEAVAEDLISNSSFSINFPFEHDNLEKLRGK
jgi:alkyl hydroperoxide reductase subunit AhpF